VFKDFRERKDIFEGVLYRRAEGVAMDDGGEAERVGIEWVSASYFDVLRVPAALGRMFVADDERVAGANNVIVLKYDF
jgi:hypothetical protein